MALPLPAGPAADCRLPALIPYIISLEIITPLVARLQT